MEMPAHNDLGNIHAAFGQMMQNPLEHSEDPVNNEDDPGQKDLVDYNPAGHIPEEEPEHSPELAVQPDPAEHVPKDQPDPVQEPLSLNEPPPHYLCPIGVICLHCQALHWDGEKLTKSTIYNPKFGMCCLQDQVYLPKLQDAPPELLNLLHGHHPLSAAFKNIVSGVTMQMPCFHLKVNVLYMHSSTSMMMRI
ncbi:hypothetical protein C0993_000641 [Termitomyces sp. T159_Od127]|nr:hypothetical protein C0993_000641 [Termitomyces sp. T159_Od127]